MERMPSEDIGGKALTYDTMEEITDTSSNRYYTFGIVTYDVNADIDGFLENVVHYCYRIHDKEDVAPHYHIFFTVQKNMTCNNVVKSFKMYQSDQSQNTFCRPMRKDEFACYDYLMHVNHPDKYQYSEDGIICDDVSKWVKVEKTNDIDSFLDDLLSPVLDLRYMCRRYGRDFMRNYKNYLEIREVIFHEDSKREEN